MFRQSNADFRFRIAEFKISSFMRVTLNRVEGIGYKVERRAALGSTAFDMSYIRPELMSKAG